MERFNCKVRYEKSMPDGSQKKVNEVVLVKAPSHGDAEKSALEEFGHLTLGEVDILGINVANYSDVVTDVNCEQERYYCAKLRFITIDERTGKEKYTTNKIIVQAADLRQAVTAVDRYMKNSIADFQIVCVQETNIQGIIDYKEIEDEKKHCKGNF